MLCMHSQGALGECGLMLHFPAHLGGHFYPEELWQNAFPPPLPHALTWNVVKNSVDNVLFANLSGWIEKGPMCCFGVELC